MLWPYEYKWDKMSNVQSFVNYIMLEVILKSHKLADPSLTSNVVIAKYWSLIEDVDDALLLQPLSELYEICRRLDRDKIRMLRRAVHTNNRIKGLCEGRLSAVRYNDIKKVFSADDDQKKVPKLIKTICNNLYTICLSRKAFTDQYGTLKSHYYNIVKRDSRCHFCGIDHSVLTMDNVYRDAFDHYLPKGIYPFVSVNTFNLVPACSDCNEKYKHEKDTLFYRQGKRAFYPYSRESYDIEVSVTFRKTDIFNLSPSDMSIALVCDGHQEETDNWNRVYGIEERYKSFCCSSCSSILTMVINGRNSVTDVLSMMEDLKSYDNNFLKIAMIKGAMSVLGV